VANQPGYRGIVFAPRPAKGFTFAKAEINTPYGIAAIDWELDGASNLSAKVVVPFGSTATLDLPISTSSTIYLNGEIVKNGAHITHGKYSVRVTNPVRIEYSQA